MGRVLVVVGAQDSSDLHRLFEVFEDRPFTEFHVLLTWPDHQAPPAAPENPAIHLTVWTGSAKQLVTALQESGAPSTHELPAWAIRVGSHTVELGAREIQRILKRFAVITERDLIPPMRFGLEELIGFLEGDLDTWAAYGAGLPIARSYVSGEGRTLCEEVETALSRVSKGDLRTFVLRLPCEPGAGATTLLRQAAFNTAGKGYPTLVLRPEQVDLDLEDLHTFAGAVADARATAQAADVPPIAIFLDVEHAMTALHNNVTNLPHACSATVAILEVCQQPKSSNGFGRSSCPWRRT